MFADRRLDQNTLEPELQRHLNEVAFFVAYLDMVETSDRLLLHFDRDRMVAIAGQPVDAGSNEEMRPQFLSQAEQFVDVALAVSNVNAPVRVAGPRYGYTTFDRPKAAAAGDVAFM